MRLGIAKSAQEAHQRLKCVDLHELGLSPTIGSSLVSQSSLKWFSVSKEVHPVPLPVEPHSIHRDFKRNAGPIVEAGLGKATEGAVKRQ